MSATHMALAHLFAWFRPYQIRWLLDKSRQRIFIKSRQIGISEVCIALEMVLTSAGLWPKHLYPYDCVVISKRERDAKKVIRRAKQWIRRLRRIPAFRARLAVDNWSATEITFSKSGFSIWSETQSEEAGRSNTGHLYLDEFAFYHYQQEIWTGARPIIISNPKLRVSVITTPNGDREMSYQIWHHGKGWSRHWCDVHKAVREGFPLDIEKERTEGGYTSDQWAQEFLCKFVAGGQDYHKRELLDRQRGELPEDLVRKVLGLDVASLQDHTAAVPVCEAVDATIWLRPPYIIAGVPYRSGPGYRGQAEICEAIMIAEGVDEAIADMGAEGSELYGLMAGRPRIGEMVRGMAVRKPWKDFWVPRLKSGLETSQVWLEDKPARMYSSTSAERFGTGLLDSIEQCQDFVDAAFVPFGADAEVLIADFRRVHKKWLSPTETTFDTIRDASGHGDSYWGACFGHYLIASSASRWKPAVTDEQEESPDMFEEDMTDDLIYLDLI